MPARSFAQRQRRGVLTLLLLASAMCVAMIAVRMGYSHTSHYGFLVWNLFLAWIPFGLAALAYAFATRRGTAAYLISVPTAVVWLLFFPNAPYILTDFLHLDAFNDTVPAWYDMMLIIWFAWTGLLLGIASLRLMHSIVARVAGRVVGWGFVLVATALGSLGIYLGRFLRWNSWDVFHSPLSMAARVWDRISEPIGQFRMVGFTGLFAALFLFVYLAAYLFGALDEESPGVERTRGLEGSDGVELPRGAEGPRGVQE